MISHDLLPKKNKVVLQKINSSMFVGNCPIKILYPGAAVSSSDTGIGSIGRVYHLILLSKNKQSHHN
jgi:hypothetical protein